MISSFFSKFAIDTKNSYCLRVDFGSCLFTDGLEIQEFFWQNIQNFLSVGTVIWKLGQFDLFFFFICILFISFSCLVALSKTLNIEQKCRRAYLLVLLSVSEEMLSKCPCSQSVGCGPTSQSLLCWSVLRLLLCRDLVHCQRPVLHLLR